MARIYVTGHRNPDLDSVASAIGYARLKNLTDSENEYIPAALGPVNVQTRAMLERLGLPDIHYLKDVYTRVNDVLRKPTLVLDADDPVYELVNMYNQNNPSVVPIMSHEGYQGLLSIDEINRYFLRENRDSRPVYDVMLRNIPRVIKGFFMKRGNSETVHAPVMVGAMDYKVFCQRLADCTVKPVLVVGSRLDHIRHAFEAGVPGIILTGMDEEGLERIDADGYDGFIYVSHEDTAETIRLFRLSVAVRKLLLPSKNIRITDNMLFEEARDILSASDQRGLAVYSHENGSFTGFITRRCFLTQPRQKIIMVDHNEAKQSVPGLEDAEIVEIVDHHRLDAPKTRNPITITSSPVGSTCTIIFDMWQRHLDELDEKTGLLLLSGITSDTVMLKSPTTTVVDKKAVEALSARFNVDYQSFCEELFSYGSSLSSLDERRAVSADFKIYSEQGVHFGIGQVEVTTFSDVPDVKEKYIRALENIRKEEHLDWTMLLVTNVMSEESLLLTTDFRLSYRLLYESKGENLYYLPGVLSRKKQLLPEIIRVLG